MQFHYLHFRHTLQMEETLEILTCLVSAKNESSLNTRTCMSESVSLFSLLDLEPLWGSDLLFWGPQFNPMILTRDIIKKHGGHFHCRAALSFFP